MSCKKYIYYLLISSLAFLFNTSHADETNLVRDIQIYLKALNFDPGPVNGKNTASTQKAIKEYQELHGLPATGETSGDLLYLLTTNKPPADFEISEINTEDGCIVTVTRDHPTGLIKLENCPVK